ncbi:MULTISPECIES: peptidoglycan-binding protein [unclassified Methanosarcina]|uniref:peptidoglycan-binding domain-containing protein n=1 Tax=unclassified Methanosarcina TaxID=2644672 RepID=UPI00061557CB|nr:MULTISPECIES: peptidoglycan-binding protein [unclassified Methanosarcina]AKB19602.1 hypothetical protein MSWHS_2739 [Methanosarcina sp. WWM596]AKB22638.1 hypothetical protein MSWH1_2367 [Methanosarcina sp. WH1]
MTIGDGHDLKSLRFADDDVLEACYDNERVLRKGDSGSPVKKVQEALILLGIPVPKVGANGILGDETELAIKSYQEARGLKVDGVIGSITIESLDGEFPSRALKHPASPSTEPQVSEVPAPLVPESPVRSPRASPVRLARETPKPVRAPPVSPVEKPVVPSVETVPDLKPLHVPPVKPVHVPPVPPVREVSARPKYVTRHIEKTTPSTVPLAPYVTSSLPQADSHNRKFHSSGMWNGDSFLEIQGGQSMHFNVKNLHAHASTIRIKPNTGESKSTVIQSQATANFEFSTDNKEPFDWRFDIKTDSDTALLEWHLYSNWVQEETKTNKP